VRVGEINCSGQCKVSGQFSFDRMGSLLTIPFVAFLQSDESGKASVGRLCYLDNTAGGMRECTD